MKTSLVVAMDPNRVIGRNNKMPWHIPDDLKYFKRVTMGKPMVMGRKTHESIGRPLPGRQNIILTRNADYEAEGCDVVHSVEDAVTVAGDAKELMVVGGSEIYQLFLAQADHLYITRVHEICEGDTWFPEFAASAWTEHLIEAGAACDWLRFDRA